MVNSKDDDSTDGSRSGDNHGDGKVDTDNRSSVCWRQTGHHLKWILCQDLYEEVFTVMRKMVMLSIVEIPNVIFSPDSAGMRKTKRASMLMRTLGWM